jgi:hypothetical protein
LKCDLNDELDSTWMRLKTSGQYREAVGGQGNREFDQKKDISKNLKWYVLPDSNKQCQLRIGGAEDLGVKGMVVAGLRVLVVPFPQQG